MNQPATPDAKPRPPIPLPFHYGWLIVAVTFFASFNGAGIRVVPTVLIHPLEADFGWARSAITFGISINLLLYGVAAPIVGWVLDKYGPRKVMLTSLTLLSAGLLCTTFVSQLWQFWLTWGVMVGLGAGGMSGVLSASVAHRWFNARRGQAVGILSSGSSTGQIVFIPFMLWIIAYTGWRTGSYILVACTGAAVLLVWMLMRDNPQDIGLEPYNQGPGAQAVPPVDKTAVKTEEAKTAAPVMGIRDAIKTPTFWLLCGVFSICGGTANGLVGTHLLPHALENGFDKLTVASAIGLMGTMNVIGTLFSGWLADRVDPRKLIAGVFTLRGLSLFYLTLVDNTAGLLFFTVVYGLDWFATVPPVVMLAGQTFGKQSIGRIYGWIFLAHQVGGSAMAWGGGLLYDYVGNYEMAFFAGGWMGLMAAAFGLSIRKKPTLPPLAPTPAGAPA
ncbi:MAG: MFS transporter [Deltaproteobacteria bacterium]|nr:MFS transporter [Deltaproteobacteria bacterium]